MIVPSSMFKRINSVFGTPSTSSPFISWAGGDGDGGGGGPKRKLVGDTFNLSNTMSYARYAELSSVDNESVKTLLVLKMLIHFQSMDLHLKHYVLV